MNKFHMNNKILPAFGKDLNFLCIKGITIRFNSLKKIYKIFFECDKKILYFDIGQNKAATVS